MIADSSLFDIVCGDGHRPEGERREAAREEIRGAHTHLEYTMHSGVSC